MRAGTRNATRTIAENHKREGHFVPLWARPVLLVAFIVMAVLANTIVLRVMASLFAISQAMYILGFIAHYHSLKKQLAPRGRHRIGYQKVTEDT